MAEALTIRADIIMAADLGIPNLKICSDSQTLIRAINSKSQIKEIYGIITDIQQISSAFNSLSFSFIPRSMNQEADELAKIYLRTSLSAFV